MLQPVEICHLYISPGHNFVGHHGREPDTHPMIEVPAMDCVAGRGIRGDRYFGFKDDTPEMRRRRLRQSNLVGPAGYVSMEDGCVGGFVQRGAAAAGDEVSVVNMGGEGTESIDTRATEASVRGFWKAYRRHMGY